MTPADLLVAPVSGARAWRQDLGRPLPAEITHFTGLTNEDLDGERIDVTAADEPIAHSHLVSAHNASFDRPFVEEVLTSAKEAAWACSRHEVPRDPALFATRTLIDHRGARPASHDGRLANPERDGQGSTLSGGTRE